MAEARVIAGHDPGPDEPEDEGPYAPLRASARRRYWDTIERLRGSIARIEERGDPVALEAIRLDCGLGARTIARNKHAQALFEAHSTHLKARREREERERKRARRRTKGQAHASDTPAPPLPRARDPLLDLTKRELAALVRTARAERDEARAAIAATRDALDGQYRALAQEHMRCAQTIMTLRADLAKHERHLAQFRSTIQHQEHAEG